MPDIEEIRNVVALDIFKRLCADFPQWDEEALQAKAMAAKAAADAITKELFNLAANPARYVYRARAHSASTAVVNPRALK